jgi:hypothetical protein
METVYKRLIEAIEKETENEEVVDSTAEVIYRNRLYSVDYRFRREYSNCHFSYDEEPSYEYIQYLEIFNWDVRDEDGEPITVKDFIPAIIEDYFTTSNIA